MTEIDLPDLLELSSFNGDIKAYIEAVYGIFFTDFVKNPPVFRGIRLGLKRHPLVDNKEYTFYHMITSGSIENNRLPDLRRCERLPWAKPTIERCDEWSLKVWEQKRGNEERICIWLELEDELDYYIVLNKRKGYLLPWTAFVLNYPHEKRKKLKEYNEWLKKAKGAR
jgi:hypothetical protein